MVRSGADESPADEGRPRRGRPSPPPTRTRGRRCELLAVADSAEVVALAEHCTEVSGPPRIVSGPETGAVALSVREPVERLEVLLGDVLATRAEVLHRDQLGWSMRLGTEPDAAVAAAICDAEVAAAGPMAALVEALCNRTELQLRALEAAQRPSAHETAAVAEPGEEA